MRLRLLFVLLGVLLWPALAHAQPAPVTWCGGSDETPGDRLPDLEVSSAQQIRFVYVVPADGVDHFPQDASGIATDAAWIDQWWRVQDPTRTPRFDRYPFPGCPSGFGQLDIGFHRLAYPATSVSSFAAPAVELETQLETHFPASQKTIVYYDGPTNNPNLCGESPEEPNDGGDVGMAFVYLQACGAEPPGMGLTADVAAHEMTHNLGAVGDGAPHQCPDHSGHVCDSSSDLMYPYASPSLDAAVLDAGRDDYYGVGAPLWDVRSSGWLEHLPQFTFSLSVGAGGTVVARDGLSNLPCDDGCSGLQLDADSRVSLVAVPSPGFAFAGWSGGCGGSSSVCTLAVAADTSASASFVRAPLKVRIAISGRGTVTAGGLRCTSTCTRTFAGTSVRFTAKPAAGWRFKGWSGACSGVGACTLTAAGTLRGVFAHR